MCSFLLHLKQTVLEPCLLHSLAECWVLGCLNSLTELVSSSKDYCCFRRTSKTLSVGVVVELAWHWELSGVATDISWDSRGLGMICCGLSSSSDYHSASSLKSKNEGLHSLMNLFSSFRRKGSLTLSSNWSRRVFSRSETAFGSAFVAFLSSSFKECEYARSFSRSFFSKSFRSWELERFSPNDCVRTSWRKSGLLLSFLLYIRASGPSRWEVMKSTLSAEAISLASKVIFTSSIKSSTGWSSTVFLPVKLFISRKDNNLLLSNRGRCQWLQWWCCGRFLERLELVIASSYFLVNSSRCFFNSSADMMIWC